MGYDLKNFAWQGIRISAPAAWSLVKVQGRRDTGYAALGDESGIRLQLRWDKGNAGGRPAEVASAYIREVRKEAQRHDAAIEVTRELNLSGPPDAETDCYEWVSLGRGVGMAAFCEKCNRMVHIGILGPRNEHLRGLARKVFSSLRDHGENGWEPWDFFDVRLEMPDDLMLKRYELKTGCIRLFFRRGGEEVEFARLSLAETLLKKSSLRHWFLDFYGSDLKTWRYAVEDTVKDGHRALRVEGIKTPLLNPGSVLGRIRSLSASAWHCDESNRLFAFVRKGLDSQKHSIAALDGRCVCCRVDSRKVTDK